MAYTPPLGNLVELNFTGSYTAPPGNDVQLIFGNVLENYIRIADVSFEPYFEKQSVTEAHLIDSHQYTIELVSNQSYIDPLIHINADSATYELVPDHYQLQILPDIINADCLYENILDDVELGGNNIYDLPIGVSPGFRFIHEGHVKADCFYEVEWGKLAPIDFFRNISSSINLSVADVFIDFIWNTMDWLDFQNRPGWKTMYPFDIFNSTSWDTMFISDIQGITYYEGNKALSDHLTFSYNQPSLFDAFVTTDYDSSVIPCDPISSQSWDLNEDAYSDYHHEVIWGPRELFSFCYQVYHPPQTGHSVDFAFPAKNVTFQEKVANAVAFLAASVKTKAELTTEKNTATTDRETAYDTYAALKVISDAAIENARIQNNIHVGIYGFVDLTAQYNIDADNAKIATDAAHADFLAKDVIYKNAVTAYLQYVEAEGLAYSNSLVLRMETISSNPRCPIIHSYTGKRDSVSTDFGVIVVPPEPPLPPFIVKQVYYIMNTVLVKTLPGNVPIEVKSISMTIDRDSWLWQLNMVIGKRDYISLLEPSGSVMQHVEVYINGWKWVFLIEGWSESRSFGKGSYNVIGRSPSLVLGDPVCDKKSFTNSITETGGSIMQGILNSNAASIGFSIAYTDYTNNQTGFDPAIGVDWVIPAEAFSYTNQPDIYALQTIAESIGAYVQTNRAFYNYGTGNDGRILEILPKYRYQPWNWTAGNTNINYIQLDKSIIKEIGTSYKKNPDYYGAYIVGEKPKDGSTTAGVFCNVYKDDMGPATLHAPVASGPLYTTNAIAQEKGRMIIGDAGVWLEHNINIYSLFPSGTAPGLLKVGDMIKVTNGATTEWRGLIHSTSITAQIVNTSAFSVTQTIGVSQYIGS
jgi:hypothetical protein